MEEEDFSKLSIEDRCVHKVWKARVSGYEAAANHFRQIDDEKSPEWNKYVGLIKKFVVDSNAPAQEKGLEATLAFVENCAAAGKTVGDVMGGLVQKAIGAPKAKTKELATQIALMYIEIEKQDVVLEELIKGTENKNPKISAGCIHIITLALQEFGAKVVNVSKILKRILVLLEDRDKGVRDESKALLVEMFRWVPTLKAQLTNLKPAQLSEIEAEYEKQKDKIAKPSRLLRSQQVKKVHNADAGPQDVNDETDMGAGVAEVDPYEFLDPVDILSQLPKNFYTQLEAKKWSERKEALDVLEKLLAAAPKLENGDYSELVKTLKKVIQKDSNVVVVGVAIKCVTGLASGLKKKFHQYSSMMMPCLFEKFKEKKQNVVVALREAVDAVYLTTTLEQILEDVITFLDNKNPSVKAEVVLFLARSFSKSTPAVLNKKLLKPLTKALLKTLSDQDQVVRDNAAQALGTAMKVTGEKTISPFLTEVDNQKLAKIKECCEKAEVIVRPQKPVETKVTESQTANKSAAQDKAVTSKAVPKPIKSGPPPIKKTDPSALQRDDALKQVTIIPQNIRTGLISQGTEKTSAYNSLKDFIGGQEKTNTFGQIILTFLYTPEAKQVDDTDAMVARVEVVKVIIESMAVPEDLLTEIVEDMGSCLSHKETKDLASTTLNLLADIFSLDSVSKTLLAQDFQDRPTLWADTLNWISNAIIKNRATVDSDFLMDCGKRALSQTDALVRNAGLALIGTAHLQVGDEKVKKTNSSSNIAKVHAVPEPAKNVAEKVSSEPLSSEVDLGAQITEQLITELGDKNWKVRAEAVAKIHTIVRGAVSITPNLGELPPVLAARISDSNSKIAVASISLVESLALAMGPQCKQHTRIFLPPLLKLIGDPKVWIRSAVQTCLNTWYESGGYKEFFEGETMAEALRTGSPSLRSELWNFLAVRLPNIPPRSLPKDELTACLPTLYSNIEDRNADVRKNACEAVLGFMIHLGFNTMNSACDNIKGAGGTQVKLLLEKTRGSVPERLPPAKSKSGNQIKMAPGSSATITKSAKPRASTKPSGSYGKKEEEADSGALLQANNLKNQRVIDDQKLKTLKWNFTTPRQEFVDLLKDLMIAANVNKQLIVNMFHSDFRYHLRAIDALIEDLSSNDLTPLTSNLDLILRWMTLRFFDTNPSVLLKGLDYLNRAFGLLITCGYQMLDYEAHSFIPYLILKVGDPKDAVRTSIRALFKQISSMFPVAKLFVFIMEGTKSKNARQRSECLDQLSWLIENYGLIVCQPTPPAALKEIAKHIADRDTTVRNAALNCIVVAYFHEGERVLKMVGQLADKDMYLLEERIKRACKNRPVASVKPMQATSPQEIDDAGVENQDYGEENGSIEENTVVNATRNMSSDDSVPSNNSYGGQSDTFSLTQQGNESYTSTPHHHTRVQTSQNSNISPGPFNLEQQLIGGNDRESNIYQPPIVEIDVEFLKEAVVMPTFQPLQMSNMTPTLSNYSQKNAVKWEITQVASSDIEKALVSVNHIGTLINSDKRSHLVGFIDLLANQLIRQLIILNQSSFPDVVTCYKANFELLVKITTYPDLCSEITENTLHKLLDRLILLLVETRLRRNERPEMFFQRTVNNTIIRFMDNSDKTNILCALINLLYETVSNPSSHELYKDLVAKCLWKMNRAQPEWDSQLDYTRLLVRINIFFRDYPSSWWKTQKNDVPLRTIKTILHTMVKVRGSQVQEIATNIPELVQDCELYMYIKKLVRHLSTTNLSDNQSHTAESSNVPSGDANQVLKSTKETHDLSEIFRMIGDTEESAEGMKKLYAFQKSHPEADITPYLSKSTPVFQQYVERGLAALEQQENPPQQTIKKKNQINTFTVTHKSPSSHIKERDNTNVFLSNENDTQDGSGNYFRKESERLWSKLQYLKEQVGLPADGRTLGDTRDDNKESKPEATRRMEPAVTTDPTLQSLKESLQIIKANME
ncbi:hypothetical protein O3M35_006719 [Rhynocoris fuscipes]|uniref:TOG domain-containing protein n=1 Tax=Rhynocoris fuscipes TaxID=488301 RepID=A0AAW1DFV2_9HEMI